MKKKILIADDHADIRHLIGVTMGKKMDIIEAEDGLTALSLTRSERPSLVVLDVMMPGEMDGFEVLEHIKADNGLCNTLVIMVTARVRPDDSGSAQRFEPDGYFLKPFSPLKLTRTINELLEKASL